VLDSGALCYTARQGDVKVLPVIDIDRVEQTCEARHEFAIRFHAIDRAVTSHQDFVFRAESAATLGKWLDGLAQHIEYERAMHKTLAAAPAGVAASATASAQPAGQQPRAPSGVLLKQRSLWPHEWQRCFISCIGSAVLYAKEDGGWQKVISLRHAKSIELVDREKLQFEIVTDRRKHKFRAHGEYQLFFWLNTLNYALSHRYATRTPGGHQVLRRCRTIAPAGSRRSALRESVQDNGRSWDSQQWEVLNSLPILRLRGSTGRG